MSDRIGVMSHGKLQQIGTPREIYTRPVNRFVASFIGETNFLPATLEGRLARLASGDMVEVAAGQGAEHLADRSRSRYRAPRAGAAGCPAGEAGAIAATIRDWVYFGTDTHCASEPGRRGRGGRAAAKQRHWR